MKRITLMLGMAVLIFNPAGVLATDKTAIEAGELTVYKSPTCGCCQKWIDHMEDAGFKVKAEDRRELGMIKRMNGVKPELASCHTAVVDGYVIEGHVPAEDVARLLQERPAVMGLTVPGMPMGSPGMEGHRKDDYQVLTFDREGDLTVYAEH